MVVFQVKSTRHLSCINSTEGSGLQEKFLGEFEVYVNVDWGRPVDFWDGEEYVKREALSYRDGFLARLLISESRVFLLSEFTPDFKIGILSPIIPGVERKQRALYIELALDKLEKSSFGRKRNTISFKPHGQLGRTVIELKGESAKLRKRIYKILEKAKALNIKAEDAGIITTDRPIREIYGQRLQIIAQRHQTAEEPTETVGKVSASTSALELTHLNSPTEFSTVSETSDRNSVSQHAEEPEPKLEPSILTYEIESLFSSEEEIEPEEKERFENAWRSLIPRETVCPYCKTRLLTIDRVCPHCGAINLY